MFTPTVGRDVQWREANRRNQKQTNQNHGLVPTPPLSGLGAFWGGGGLAHVIGPWNGLASLPLPLHTVKLKLAALMVTWHKDTFACPHLPIKCPVLCHTLSSLPT